MFDLPYLAVLMLNKIYANIITLKKPAKISKSAVYILY